PRRRFHSQKGLGCQLMDMSLLAPIFKPHQSALLICDMQNDFVKSSAPEFARFHHILAVNVSLLERARSLGLPVAYTQRMGRKDGLQASAAHRLKNLGKAPGGAPLGVEGTWGAEICDELRPRPEDIVVDKVRYSGFFQTPLATLLRGLGVTYLLMTGLATNW